MVEQRREQQQRFQRLTARARRRHEPPRGRKLAQAHDRLHAQRGGIPEIIAEFFPRGRRDEEGENRRARAPGRTRAKVEQRIERRIPTAPRDQRRLPQRKCLNRTLQRRGAGVIDDFRRRQQLRSRSDAFQINQIPAQGRHRRRARTRTLQQGRTHGPQVDRQHPSGNSHDHAGYRQTDRGGQDATEGRHAHVN